MEPYQIRPLASRSGPDDFDRVAAGLRDHTTTFEFRTNFSALPLEPSWDKRDIRVIPTAFRLFGVDWYTDAFAMLGCRVTRQTVSPLEGTVGLTIDSPAVVEERQVERWRRVGYRALKPLARLLRRI